MCPINECRASGPFGLIKGIWQGFSGFFIKPVVGAYDLIITIAEGLMNNHKYEESIMEHASRPPRIFQ
jgi:hypothetical protein